MKRLATLFCSCLLVTLAAAAMAGEATTLPYGTGGADPTFLLCNPPLVCPPGAQLEGEPPCGPNYVDATNGGCNSTPPVFTNVVCNTVCGKMGTFTSPLGATRDTDWYRVNGPGNYSGIADGYTLRLFVLGAVCPPVILSTLTTPSCVQSANLAIPAGAGYLFAGTDVFAGVPCETPYVLSISSAPPCGVTAVESSTWGAIKSIYE